MKVSRDTPDQLILENNPIVLAILISAFGLIFVAVGMFIMADEFWVGVGFISAGLISIVVFNLAFTRRTQFIFDRPTNRVEMRRKSLLGYSKRNWELAHLERAVIETSRSDTSNTYRAALGFVGGMEPGAVRITLVYASGKGAERAANAVNGWLAAPG